MKHELQTSKFSLQKEIKKLSIFQFFHDEDEIVIVKSLINSLEILETMARQLISKPDNHF